MYTSISQLMHLCKCKYSHSLHSTALLVNVSDHFSDSTLYKEILNIGEWKLLFLNFLINLTTLSDHLAWCIRMLVCRYSWSPTYSTGLSDRGGPSGWSSVVDNSIWNRTVVLVQVGDTGRLDYSMANVTLTECWHNGGVRVWAFGSLTTSIIRVVLHGAFSWQVVIGWASVEMKKL